MLIKVRVTTGSYAEQIVKKADDHFVVSVKQEAERNMANTMVLGIFQEMFPDKSAAPL